MKKNEKRISLIKKVIKAENDFQSLITELANYDWDFSGEPVILAKENIKNLLARFLVGDVSKKFICEWAEFLELRDDVDYPEDEEDLLSEIIHELANPDTEGELTTDRAGLLLTRLRH